MVNEVVSNHLLQPAPLVSRAKPSAPASEPARQENTAAPHKSEAPVNGASSTEVELDVVDAVQRVQDYVQTIERDLQFSIDEDSGRTIIKVIDPETDEVVRQIPPEELLNILQSLESGNGGLVKAKA